MAQRLLGWRHLFQVALAGIALSVGCNPPKPAPEDARKEQASSRDPGSGRSRSLGSSSIESAISVERIADDLTETTFENGAEKGLFSLPETLGGGLAVIDYDQDGLLDIIGSGGGTPNLEQRRMEGRKGALWQARSSMRHVDVTLQARIDLSSCYNHGIIAADYDADGFVDFVVTGYPSLLLFRNQGDGTFELATDQARIEDKQWSCAAAFLDVDNDGDLDLFIAHYADWSFDHNPVCASHYDASKRDYCGPRDFKGLESSMYENLGDGTFRDVSDAIRLDGAHRSLGVLAADLDNDRDVEIYVANDVESNLLFRNDGGWSFTEMGVRSGVANDDKGRPEGSMGIGLGDYNNDGRFDIWVTNYQSEINALYRNDGALSFSYASRSAQIASTDNLSVGWGTAFNDFDLDGDEDLIVINGHLESHSPGSPFKQRPQILENVDGKMFRLCPGTHSSFLNTPQSGRGLALADFDGDGLFDFAVTRTGEPHTIVRNTSERAGRYLEVRLIGTASNRDAIGTTLRLQVGNRTWIRQVIGGGSFASTNNPTVHFGIPKDLGDKATLTIAWPSGLDQTQELSKLDSKLLVIEGIDP